MLIDACHQQSMKQLISSKHMLERISNCYCYVPSPKAWQVTCTKDLRGNPKPEFPRPEPVRDQDTFLRIFSGQVGVTEFGLVRVGVFFTRVLYIFPRILELKWN